MQTPPPSVRTVSIPFSDLKERDRDLSGKIEEGLGPNGLGIISIADVPGFPLLRKALLRLAPRIADLPEDVKKGLEDTDSRYNFGWSHGKEKLDSGKFDTFKGSFYANPILDVPITDDVLVRRYPSYCRPNIWPTGHLPELEIAFKALGKLMLEVGLMLAHHCDRYVMQQGVGLYDGEILELTIANSRCHKGRLLYYFPRQFSNQKEGGSVSSWCGWHTDHGSLTGYYYYPPTLPGLGEEYNLFHGIRALGSLPSPLSSRRCCRHHGRRATSVVGAGLLLPPPPLPSLSLVLLDLLLAARLRVVSSPSRRWRPPPPPSPLRLGHVRPGRRRWSTLLPLPRRATARLGRRWADAAANTLSSLFGGLAATRAPSSFLALAPPLMATGAPFSFLAPLVRSSAPHTPALRPR
ncbi:hypothetical protein GUJ93_ZPchr0057g2644 [Zizania palustris]|uniref:Non-haem dioxygenase N-terminal domain-containing protein n=1 Tax=Zizania palustris TaxID=103762 RepID=A0A8J5R2V7_ZIZPA|nr:hypothetical protein GUJ93_ZPchr0057g2644 [Zizania palustris]